MLIKFVNIHVYHFGKITAAEMKCIRGIVEKTRGDREREREREREGGGEMKESEMPLDRRKHWLAYSQRSQGRQTLLIF